MTTDAGSYLLLGADIFYRLVEREHNSGSDQIHGKESTDTFYFFDFHFWVASLADLTFNMFLNPGKHYCNQKYPFDISSPRIDFTDVTHLNLGLLAYLMSLSFDTFSGSCFRWLVLAQPHARGFSHSL
jgi:hypothetical protein